MNKRDFIKAYTNADTEQERNMILAKYKREQPVKSVFIIGGDGSSIMGDLLKTNLKEGKDWEIIDNKFHLYF